MHGSWKGLTCLACYGPASMTDAHGRAYCFEHSAGRQRLEEAMSETKIGVCSVSPVPHALDAHRCQNHYELREPDGGPKEDVEEVEKALGNHAYDRKDIRSTEAVMRFLRLTAHMRAANAEPSAEIDRLRRALAESEKESEQRRVKWCAASSQVEVLEKERDAMALALARKVVAT